jgi:hypothetical protein
VQQEQQVWEEPLERSAEGQGFERPAGGQGQKLLAEE